jgi:alpha-tubulin suppressor-like RCC1 family protein
MKSALNSGLRLVNLVAVLLWQPASTQAATTVTNIAPGCVAEHSLFLKSDGSLWAMGFNRYGQLGDGIYSTNSPYGTNRPEQIIPSGVKAIAAGSGHSLFLKSDGSLWAMGANFYGDLGDGTDYNETNRPEQIVAEGVTDIAAGLDDSFFIKSDGSLWAMGWNEYGELGDGTFGNGQLNDVNQPEQIVASGVKAIAAGAYHSLFLKSDGSLWAMGRNDMGQLGDGTYSTNYPYGVNQPEQIIPSGVTAIAAGFDFSLFLKSDGSLWAMGANDSGQLGDGTYSTNYPNGIDRPEQIVAGGVTAIAAGASHSLFLKSDGSLWVMGFNYFGQLGDGTYSRNSRYGINRPEQIVASGVTAIAAGRDHSLFLKSDGSLWGMGLDSEGELGDGFFGTNYCSSIPEQIVPSPQPLLTDISILSRTNLQFKATCFFGGTYHLLAGKNLAQPFSQWTPVGPIPSPHAAQIISLP